MKTYYTVYANEHGEYNKSLAMGDNLVKVVGIFAEYLLGERRYDNEEYAMWITLEKTITDDDGVILSAKTIKAVRTDDLDWWHDLYSDTSDGCDSP